MLRFGVDTGGTFTDLVVAGDPRGVRFYKRPTTPDDPVRGLIDVVAAAAADLGCGVEELLRRGDLFIFGTTRATNAIVERATARTALLTTEGHPDILYLREGGGRPSLFDYSHEYPDPYVPRALTFEVRERIGSQGEVVEPLDEQALTATLAEAGRREVEAIAVSLLWSIVNPAHELRVGELIEARLPGVPYTLSHRLNPTLREYRRTSSAAIDASLKPLMSRFFGELSERLRAAGFGGRLLLMTSSGGVLDADAVRDTPIHSIGSGPAAAPVAGRHFTRLDADCENAIVTDAGGTTYDVSLIRRGQIPWTRETMVGPAPFGYITGFPSVDVRSVGAGGGSIARVDEGGLLHVGPQSAGADPGPACYGRGGTRATVTDACLALGYIDPDYFLGGEMRLDVDAARAALERDVASGLGTGVEEAAGAVLQLAIERMVRAIEEITLNQGIDPSAAVLVGGGGGAGLYSAGVARRLGCPRVFIPAVSAALSATGALLSDLHGEYATTAVTTTAGFDHALAERVLTGLEERCSAFAGGPGADAVATEVRYSVEARYPHQVWEIEVPLERDRFSNDGGVERFREDFHTTHEQLFAMSDRDSEVELVTWRARVRCDLGGIEAVRAAAPGGARARPRPRAAWFPGLGSIPADVHLIGDLEVGRRIDGPAIVESPVTTVVVDPEAAAELAPTGSIVLHPRGAPAPEPLAEGAQPL
jgi:N-methylhydantoinase A